MAFRHKFMAEFPFSRTVTMQIEMLLCDCPPCPNGGLNA